MDSFEPISTIMLFPTMPLALLAVTRMIASPSLVLADDDSTLNNDISAGNARQSGIVVRNFHERRDGIIFDAPPLRLAVHDNLTILNSRLHQNDAEIVPIWNHVEHLSERELPLVLSNIPSQMFSATLLLGGFPSAVGLLLQASKQDTAKKAAAFLGLRYDDGRT